MSVAVAAMLILVFMPLLAAPLALVAGLRSAPWLPLLVVLFVLLAAAVLAHEVLDHGLALHSLGGWAPPLGIAWKADGLAAAMLLTSAAVTAAVAVFVALDPQSAGFSARAALMYWVLSLFLLSALNAVFLSGDVFNIYVTLELATLAAVALVGLAQKTTALRAALRYLLIALIGSISYLFGVALLYAEFATLDLGLLGERMQPTLSAQLALAMMTVGLLAKTALFPFHTWLPSAHGSAPAPASALLSALVVMASFYCLLRLWIVVFPSLLAPAFLQLMGGLGAIAVLGGSWLAYRQRRLKLLVAYSTVAQLGYLLLLPPLLFTAGAVNAWIGVIYLAIAHAFAKAAMFLGAGLILHARGHDRLGALQGTAGQLPMVCLALGLAGLTLMGLPPSGGFVAKWLLLQGAIAAGQWWWLLVLFGGGFFAAAYMFAVLNPMLAQSDAEGRPVRAGLQWLTLLLALISVLLGVWATPLVGLLDSGLPSELGGVP